MRSPGSGDCHELFVGFCEVMGTASLWFRVWGVWGLGFRGLGFGVRGFGLWGQGSRRLPFDASGCFGERAAMLGIQQSAWPPRPIDYSTTTTATKFNFKTVHHRNHHRATLSKTKRTNGIEVQTFKFNPVASRSAL